MVGEIFWFPRYWFCCGVHLEFHFHIAACFFFFKAADPFEDVAVFGKEPYYPVRCFTVLIQRSLGSLSLPSGSIFSIPSSSRMSLQISGGESFDYNEFGVCSPVLFLTVTGNSPLTFSL